jgi:hypothetical protein
MKARALKFVPFRKIEDHFRQGWVILIPKWETHHDYYGCEMAWICECAVPGGFVGRRVKRVPATQKTEGAHERAGA